MAYTGKVVRPSEAEIEIKAGGTLSVESTGIINIETGGIIKANGTQAGHIANVADAAGAAPDAAEFNAFAAKFNSLLAAIENVGILAKS